MGWRQKKQMKVQISSGSPAAFASPWDGHGLVKVSVPHQGSYIAADEQCSQRRPDLETIDHVISYLISNTQQQYGVPT